MNKRIIAIILVFVFLFLIVSYAANKAWALTDPFSFYTIGGIAYAMATDWGISFTTAAATSEGLSNWMSGQLGDYCDYRQKTITELFGSEAARMVAGKLVVGQTMVNGIMGFIDWLTEQFGSDENLASSFDGSVLPYVGGPSPSVTGKGIEVIFDGQGVGDTAYQATGYYNGVRKFYRTRYSGNGGIEKKYPVYLNLEDGDIYINLTQVDGEMAIVAIEPYKVVTNPSLEEVLNWDSTGYSRPTVLNPDQEWTGTIGGHDWPDTNLDELIGKIYEDLGLNDLQVEGEIVDPVVPPTPVPTVAPDTPLQDAPWEGLNDLIGSSTGTISQGIQDQTDAITGAQEATTEAVESLTDTIEGALDTPTTEELPDFKFDLRELFPFCIPFDIYRLLSSFDAEPVAPHVQLPIVIDSINFRYNLDLDFSAWNPVAQAMRTAELIVYAIALAWATGKVIKW